jgi:hypothetical protein
MEKDKEFLKACHLMDYSLLLIFFKKEQEIDSFDEDEDMEQPQSLSHS